MTQWLVPQKLVVYGSTSITKYLQSFTSPTTSHRLLFAGCYWVRFPQQITLFGSQPQRYPKDITSFWVILCTSQLEFYSDTKTSSLGSSRIVITTSGNVKMWMLVSRSVLTEYQNSGSTAVQHLRYLLKAFLEKFIKVIKLLSMLDGLSFFT